MTEPFPVGVPVATIVNRLLKDRFERCFIPEPNSGCWLWLASVNHRGYGWFRFPKNGEMRSSLAHRASWEIHRSPIPSGLFVCHKCDVPACVNPDHLFLGTAKDNSNDRDRKGRTSHTRGMDQGTAKLSDADVLAIIDDPRTLEQIAADYGVAHSTVCGIKIGRGWTHITNGRTDRRGTPCGEKQGNAKLTASDIKAIRQDPRPYREICDAYGIRDSHVSRIKNRKCWTHIE